MGRLYRWPRLRGGLTFALRLHLCLVLKNTSAEMEYGYDARCTRGQLSTELLKNGPCVPDAITCFFHASSRARKQEKAFFTCLDPFCNCWVVASATKWSLVPVAMHWS